MTLRLSVLDQSPIVSGGSSADALRATVEESQAYPYTERDRAIIGTPDKVKARLLEITDAYAADELMVITITGDYASRMRSYELLAAEFGLTTSPHPPHPNPLPPEGGEGVNNRDA